MILRLEKKYNFHFQKISFSTTRKTVIRDIAVRSCRFLYHFVCDFGAFSAREKKTLQNRHTDGHKERW